MRQLSTKVITLEQCYVGEGIDGHTGTADLSDTEVALIQQVTFIQCITATGLCLAAACMDPQRGPSDLVGHVC